MTAPEPNILAGLPKDTPEVEYYGHMDLLKEAHRLFEELENKKSSCDYVVFKNVPKLRAKVAFDDEGNNGQIADYDKERKFLVLQSSDLIHNIAIEDLKIKLFLKMHHMGLKDELHPYGRAEIHTPTRIKQPWGQFGVNLTRLQPDRLAKWPTVVFLCGLSESGPKLEKDMEFWLDASHGDVMFGIALVLDQNFIEISTWSGGKSESESEPERQPTSKKRSNSSTPESDLPATKKRGVTNDSDYPDRRTRGSNEKPPSSESNDNDTKKDFPPSDSKKDGTAEESAVTSPDSKKIDGVAKAEAREEPMPPDSSGPSGGGITKNAVVRINRGPNYKAEFADGVDSITIPFSSIFLRPPRSGECEEDLVMDSRDLSHLARSLWMITADQEVEDD